MKPDFELIRIVLSVAQFSVPSLVLAIFCLHRARRATEGRMRPAFILVAIAALVAGFHGVFLLYCINFVPFMFAGWGAPEHSAWALLEAWEWLLIGQPLAFLYLAVVVRRGGRQEVSVTH